MNEPLPSEYQDDQEFLGILRLYVSELPQRVANLRLAWQSGDRQQLAHLAHQIKGAGGMYGYPDLTLQAAALQAAAEGQTSHSQLGQLIDAFAHLVQRIQQGLPTAE